MQNKIRYEQLEARCTCRAVTIRCECLPRYLQINADIVDSKRLILRNVIIARVRSIIENLIGTCNI